MLYKLQTTQNDFQKRNDEINTRPDSVANLSASIKINIATCKKYAHILYKYFTNKLKYKKHKKLYSCIIRNMVYTLCDKYS